MGDRDTFSNRLKSRTATLEKQNLTQRHSRSVVLTVDCSLHEAESLLRSWCTMGGRIQCLPQNASNQYPLNISWHTWILPTFLQLISLRYIFISSINICLVSQVVTSLHTFLPNFYVSSSSLSHTCYYCTYLTFPCLTILITFGVKYKL